MPLQKEEQTLMLMPRVLPGPIDIKEG